ncbi:MAG: CpsD/CapB family tyrosine-protein kinase, partial [Rikenellaceae bacterium]
IPQIVTNKGKKAFKQQNMSNLIIDGSRSVINEAFRVVRTNLDFMTSENNEGGQVIQLISMNPGSGKTFITSNLGYSMALKDAKVLIIDADIRKSTLSNLVNAPKLGVSDYLSGKKDNVDELILKGVTHENLDVLPVGKTPPNPSELLLKPRFADLIAEMKARYDYIFLDCPPVEVVPDAAIIGKLCDTAIFVVRAGNLDKRLLPDIETIYESKKYNNMCLLLNDVCYSGKGYYGYRRYGYYGYGYGYGNEGAAK